MCDCCRRPHTGSRYCPDCVERKRLQRQRRMADPEYAAAMARKRRASWDHRRLARRGLTQEQHDVMLAAQGGGCAICGAAEGDSSGRAFHIDHDHDTGVVRGLLCHRCNRALGLMRDDPDIVRAAADYLAVATAA